METSLSNFSATRVVSSLQVILLVGGFAGNPYLRSQLHEYADQKGVALFFPEHQTYVDLAYFVPRMRFSEKIYLCRAKAVAEGALWYHLDHYVSARCAKYVYGTECHTAYDGSMPDHQARLHKVVTHADGQLYVPGAFSRIIPKVIPSRFNVVTVSSANVRHNSGHPGHGRTGVSCEFHLEVEETPL